MRLSRRSLTHLAILAVILALAGMGALVVRRLRPPFDLALLQELHRGMSEEEVQAILGMPTRKVRNSWIYVNPRSWPRVKLEFDGKGAYSHSTYEFF